MKIEKKKKKGIFHRRFSRSRLNWGWWKDHQLTLEHTLHWHTFSATEAAAFTFSNMKNRKTKKTFSNIRLLSVCCLSPVLLCCAVLLLLLKWNSANKTTTNKTGWLATHTHTPTSKKRAAFNLDKKALEGRKEGSKKIWYKVDRAGSSQSLIKAYWQPSW